MPCKVLAPVYTLLVALIFSSCGGSFDNGDETKIDTAVAFSNPEMIDSILDKKDQVALQRSIDTIKMASLDKGEAIDTRDLNPEDVIRFAESLVGTPYVYGSTDPKVGFDCSGFITYVFNNFKVRVPRSSVQFTNVGKTLPVENAKRGDIVLFTDPDFDNVQSTEIGHMGLITANSNGLISFIHSTSGKAMSVTVTPLSEHYKKRFVRIARIFPQNDS